MLEQPPRGYIGCGYSGTTVALSRIYRGIPVKGTVWPPERRYDDNAIDELRFRYVLWHQQMYKRRFWSRRLLIRLLEVLVMTVYFHRLAGRPLDKSYKASVLRQGGLFDELLDMQTTPSIHFMVPTLRPIPKSTLFPKLEWLLDKLMQSEHFIERDSHSPNEFFQHWTSFVRKQSNLPLKWFTWHNDEFPEYYEWNSEVADDDDLRDFAINIVE